MLQIEVLTYANEVQYPRPRYRLWEVFAGALVSEQVEGDWSKIQLKWRL